MLLLVALIFQTSISALQAQSALFELSSNIWDIRNSFFSIFFCFATCERSHPIREKIDEQSYSYLVGLRACIFHRLCYTCIL